MRFLLLQVRNPDDPMRSQEVGCFARALNCAREQIEVHDLIASAPTVNELSPYQAVLLGGSGDYSVAEGGPWLEKGLLAMRELFELGKPTFASCWGFQAMSLALGGEVVNDISRAELGTVPVRLTEAGRSDRLFKAMPPEFLVQMGHQDIVDRLPPKAVLLASTDRVTNQAFTFPGKPIYATQFHPELDRAALLDRVRTYPRYVEEIAGIPPEEFERLHCHESPESNGLLKRFVELI